MVQFINGSEINFINFDVLSEYSTACWLKRRSASPQDRYITYSKEPLKETTCCFHNTTLVVVFSKTKKNIGFFMKVVYCIRRSFIVIVCSCLVELYNQRDMALILVVYWLLSEKEANFKHNIFGLYIYIYFFFCKPKLQWRGAQALTKKNRAWLPTAI